MKQLINFVLTSLFLANVALAEPKNASAQAKTSPKPEASSTASQSAIFPKPSEVSPIVLSEEDLSSVRAAVPEDKPAKPESASQPAVPSPQPSLTLPEPETATQAVNLSDNPEIPAPENIVPSDIEPAHLQDMPDFETEINPIQTTAAALETPPPQIILEPEAEITPLQPELAPEATTIAKETVAPLVVPEPVSPHVLTLSEPETVPAQGLTLSEPEVIPEPVETLSEAQATLLAPANPMPVTPIAPLPVELVAQTSQSAPAAVPVLEPETTAAAPISLSEVEFAPLQNPMLPEPEVAAPQFHPFEDGLTQAETIPPQAPPVLPAEPEQAPAPNAFSAQPATAPLQPSPASQVATGAAQPEVIILKNPDNLGSYMLSPGDALEITVWKEEGLQQLQFLIGPDGNIIYPLIGTITAAGRTLNDLKELITFKLADYIADPSISIKLINNQGNAVFVIGKVNKPGQVVASRRIDVLQALSLAGGLTVFADESNITVQRRINDDVKVFPFDYGDVIDGEHLEQNILLEPGDTIAVP